MNDHDELQGLLSRIPEGIPLNSNSSLGQKRSSSDDITKKPPSDTYRQWQVAPNDTFLPCGNTIASLPSAVYTVVIIGEQLGFAKLDINTDQLIELHDASSAKVLNGIRTFWARKTEYEKRGLLFKRGILLWGPAGSGKTALLALLMNELLRMGGVCLIVRSPMLAGTGLKFLRKIEPDRPLIVVLEDIEEIVREFSEHMLLSLLDGEHQVANVVNLATTNYPELLGARIVNRPSRFDEVLKIGLPDGIVRQRYLAHVLKKEEPSVSEKEIRRMVRDTDGMSIAHLKELVAATRCLGQPYEEVLYRLKSMSRQPKSTTAAEAGFTVVKKMPDEYQEPSENDPSFVEEGE